MLMTVLLLAFARSCVGSAQSHVLAVVLALAAALLLWGVVGGLQIDVKLKFKALGEVTAAGVAGIFLVVHFVSADGIIASEGCQQIIHGRVLLGDSDTRGVAGAVVKGEHSRGWAPQVTTDENGSFTMIVHAPVPSVKLWAQKPGFDDSTSEEIELPYKDEKKVYLAMKQNGGAPDDVRDSGGNGSGSPPEPDGEPVKVHGQVVDAATRTGGLAGVTVAVASAKGDARISTDSRGHYETTLPAGTTQVDLGFSKAGYGTFTKKGMSLPFPKSGFNVALKQSTTTTSTTPTTEDGPPKIAPSGTGPCTMTLTDYVDGKKISVIKAVREHTGLGLKEALYVVEHLPFTIKIKISQEELDKIGGAIKAAGGGYKASCR